MPNEDVIICQAWIAASEDPIIGTGQKITTFQNAMYEAYLTFLANNDSQKGVSLPCRTLNAMYNCFQAVAKKCTLLHGVFGSTSPRSGMTSDDHFRFCLEVYKDRHGQSADDIVDAYKYLSTKAKWISHLLANKEAQEPPRLPGKKKQAGRVRKEEDFKQVLVNCGFDVPNDDDKQGSIVSPLSDKTHDFAAMDESMIIPGLCQ